MFKKILLGIGGLFVFLIVIAIATAPEPKINTENNTAVENAGTTTNVIIPSDKLTIATSNPAPETETKSQYTYYAISSVVDGDTVKVNINGNIETLRLIGLDTPETVDPRKPVQCFGIEASNKAKELLSGQKVRIEKDPTQGDYDKYGRTLAYIYREDGLFYNKYMIEQGYAHEYTYDLPYKYQTEFKAAKKAAQENQLGLWSPATCNGDTASSSVTTTQTTSTTVSTNIYYTSSYYTSKYYYPESCDGWRSLSTKYLKSFNSLEDLLAAYPSRTLSPQCQ